MAAIEPENLTKHFGDEVALDGLDLVVEGREVFGFLGSNGYWPSTYEKYASEATRPRAVRGRPRRPAGA